MAPGLQHQQFAAQRIELVGPSFIEFKHKELLNKLSGHGLQVSYRFTRSPHLYSSAMVSIELQFVNLHTENITNICMGQKTLPNGMQLNEFAPINCLMPQQTATSVLGVDYNDSTHAIEFEIKSSQGLSKITLKTPLGELIRSVFITDSHFKDERLKLKGMNEHQTKLPLKRGGSLSDSVIKQRIFESINVANIPCSPSEGDPSQQPLYFAGQTMTSKSLVLITLEWNAKAEDLTILVNCEKMVIGSMVLSELRNSLHSLMNGKK